MIAAVQTFLLPAWILEWKFGLNKLKPEDLLTIIYTSGSTGKPKGAMISNRAVSMNIDGFRRIIKFVPTDRILAVLPFFHAFGFTIEIWVPMIINVGTAYHYTPLEPKRIGDMSKEFQCTLLVVTPTFARTYLRKCPRDAFEHVGTVILGAEKMPKDLADAWEEKYGVRPVEGYGTTELSPVVATNIAKVRIHDDYQPCTREGSIGRPLPFLAVKIVDPQTFEELPPDTPGMLVIKSPTVMNGYYREPELTAKALHNGWYITGDIAKLDKDGFVFITGRESRISKIGGEMVPHIMIEETLLEILKKHIAQNSQQQSEQSNLQQQNEQSNLQSPNAPQQNAQSNLQSANTQQSNAVQQNAQQPNAVSQDDELPKIPLAVAALPDEKKGEKIIVLYTDLPVSPDVLCREMLSTGCPNIWVPSPLHFYQVAEIPLLATGKLDLGKLREMVKEIEKKEAGE